MRPTKLCGITVLPEYIQSEGVERVLDNLVERARATAVATSPYVMQPATEQTGAQEPPIDAGAGHVRLLDRPLWGQRKLWVATAPSFVPDKSLYAGLRYQPPEPTDLTAEQGGLIERFIDQAQQRGLLVYLQVQAAIPPGYRVQFGGPLEEDLPRMPDGSTPPRRVDKNGSLASPHILHYTRALAADLCRAYPGIDGLRFDWPEYPPYHLDCMFFDFSDHAQRAASELDFDFPLMKRDAERLYQRLHGQLTDDELDRWADQLSESPPLLPRLADYPGAAQLLEFKSVLVDRYLAQLRQAMDRSTEKPIRLAPAAFPPPWSFVSGMDFQRASKWCDEVAVKLYGMHWSMMLRFYGDQLLAANPGLTSERVARLLVKLLDIAESRPAQRVEDFGYPPPDQPHPIGREAQIRKIRAAQQQAGAMPIHAFAHGYGPLDDFRRRLDAARQASPYGFWVNRYAYLSDAKLDAIGQR